MDNSEYSNLCNGNFHHVVYLFWVLKNNTDIDIKLVTNLPKSIKSSDIVFFHYESRQKINFGNYKTIQIIGDFPILKEANYYITHNGQMKNQNTFFMYFPLPANIKRFKPVFPPKNFVGVGAEHSFNKEIMGKKFIESCKQYNINLEFITDKNYAYKNVDVFIFLRDKNLPNYKKDNGEPLHPSAIWSPITGKTHRHANRLYQSWYMNTPCILNKEATIEPLIKTKYDALFAETPAELFCKMIFLQNNKEFFHKMIYNCKKRANENTHKKIALQFKRIISKIK